MAEALTADQVQAQAKVLRGYADSERRQLNVVRRYWKGVQNIPTVIPADAPREVKVMARIARVNICPIVVDSLAQSTFVDGFRGTTESDNAAVWDVWQANKMDARQTGIHRATFAYGAAYAVVTEGDPYPVIRGVSPRSMTAMYGEDPDWPIWALERMDAQSWRLYDDNYIYLLGDEKRNGDYSFIEAREHGADVVPVIRYLDEDDLDADDDVELNEAIFWQGLRVPMRGQIAPLMTLQDQIDVTTFGLLTAQWYGAFRQRYIVGWIAESEAQLLKAGASRIMTFADPPDDTGEGGVKVGEFGQTTLGGYIESREASLRHAATLSQTPVHELLGELVNLSAEALAAAESGHDRKVDERKTMLGESHEQTLRLAAELDGVKIPDDAEVIWRDTSARSFAATVDGLGKLTTMLGVPPEELWQRIPGVTQQDVERWKAAAQQGGAFEQLAKILERQAQPPAPTPAA